MRKLAQVVKIALIALVACAPSYAEDIAPVLSVKNAYAKGVNSPEALRNFLSSDLPIAEGDVRFADGRKELVMAREESEEASAALTFDKWVTEILNSPQGVSGYGPNHSRKGIRIVAREREAALKLAGRLDFLVKSHAIARDVFNEHPVIVGDDSGLKSIELMELRIRFGNAIRLSLSHLGAPTKAQSDFVAKEGEYLGGELMLRVTDEELARKSSDIKTIVNRWLRNRYVTGITVSVQTSGVPSKPQSQLYANLFSEKSKMNARLKTSEVILQFQPQPLSR